MKLLQSKIKKIIFSIYIGIIILLFLGAWLEVVHVLPSSDMGGVLTWVLILASYPLMPIIRNITSDVTLVIIVGVLYHVFVGLVLAWFIEKIYFYLKNMRKKL